MNTRQPITWTIRDVLDATGGALYTGSKGAVFEGFSTDSRNIRQGQCFICLRGEHHDGHNFIANVMRQGIKGIIVDQTAADQALFRDMEAAQVTSIAVDDTTSALGDIASYHRKRSELSVIALTGSNGKTTTRTMMTDVVGRRFQVLSPIGNFNNLIGVPLTLLRIEPHHEWAILELGMNRSGEILRLGQICRPDIGLITNVGPAHLEGLGSLEGVMNAKGELIETVSARGTMVFNADDPMVMRLAKKASCKTILFGFSRDADIRATSLESRANTLSFQLHVPGDGTEVKLPIPGKFNVSNALAAAAVGYRLGIPLVQIAAALNSFAPVKGRLNILQTHQGFHLIDDTYNANPGSVKAAIQTLVKLSREERAIAVLGDMLELGEASADLHADIGRFAATLGVNKLYMTGRFADAMATGAREAGMAARNLYCGSKREIHSHLIRAIQAKDWILIKGSRGMRMETLVQALQTEYDDTGKAS